jgi:hypothetical protein
MSKFSGAGIYFNGKKIEKLRIGSTMNKNSGEEFLRSNYAYEIQLS